MSEVSTRTPDRLDRPFADPLVSRLFPPLATGVHWDLDRSFRALEALGDPHLAYPTVHIGGTNGKGSVTSTVGSVLQVAGYKTGCYTSPHLCSFRERMLVSGQPLGEETILAYAADVLGPVQEFGLTFFEAITVLAMYAFAREGVDFGVMEVGLGGRLDATNVVRPEVTAVTNVAMDHAEYLGSTVEAIAREKAGIMKAGVPFVTAEPRPETVELFRTLAADVGAPFHRVSDADLRDVCVSVEETTLTAPSERWGDVALRTPLVGHHQASNAALALAIVERLDGRFRPTLDAVVEGVGVVRYHGRDEVQTVGDTTFLFDVAHNTAGIRSLVDTIDRLDLPGPLVALVGVLGDKDWHEMLPALLSRVESAVLTQPPSAPEGRRWDPLEAAAVVEGLTEVRVIDDFVSALDFARLQAGRGTVVATGSVHTVGSAMSLLGLDPLGR